MFTLNTPEAKALRDQFGWDDWTIQRHLQQRQSLQRQAGEQQRRRANEALRDFLAGKR
jgi:hypothetical protein